MNKIVAVVGLCGSGKSEVCRVFEDAAYTKVYFGSITLEEVKRRGLEINEQNEKAVREEIRKTHGMAAYAILNLPKIEAGLKQGNVLIDGLYSWSEYVELRNEYGDRLKVIAVFAPKKLRYARLAQRKIRPLTREDVDKRDKAEIENIEKGGPIAAANYTIINDRGMEDLRKQAEKIKKEIEKEK